MAKTFLDSNIIIYANDSRDPEKQSAAIEIVAAHLRTGEGVISTQVMQEYAAVALGKLSQSPEVVARQLALLEAMEVVAVSPTLVKRAVEIRRLYQVSFWDACIIAAAESARCGRILSEDLATGQFYSGVEVVNPFAGTDSSPTGMSEDDM